MPHHEWDLSAETYIGAEQTCTNEKQSRLQSPAEPGGARPNQHPGIKCSLHLSLSSVSERPAAAAGREHLWVYLPSGVMCWKLRSILSRRSCRPEGETACLRPRAGLSDSFSRTWSRFSSRTTTMRTRSEPTETDGFRLNFRLDQNLKSAGGRWFKRWRSPRAPAGPDHSSGPDGQLPAREEEEPRRGDSSNICSFSPPVMLTFEQLLEEKRLSEASQLLIEREERLFGEIKATEALKHHQEDVDKLAADRGALRDAVRRTVELSLGPEALASAVTAILQEEDQDRQWQQRAGTPPAWRPCGLKALHDSTLRRLVEERIDNPSTPPAEQPEQSSIQGDIHSMGRQLKEDLLLVVAVVKRCYPPEWDICNCYARLYHETLSARLRKIAEFGLVDKDGTFLLRWVNDFYPQILGKPELTSEIDAESLGKLLPEKLLEPLEKQYLSKQQEELTTFIGRALEEEKQRWTDGQEPAREDGCFVSHVAYDVIQLINGMVTSAERVVGDRQKAQSITCQLDGLMQRFRTFQNDVMRLNKANSRPIVKANLGCIELFTDVLDKKSHLFPKDVQQTCLHVLDVMKQSAHAYLLAPVHATLMPQYRKLGTSDWLKKPLFDKLLVSIEKEVQDLQGSIPSCHQKLIGQLHQEVTAEYVKRLLKGKVSLKDKKEQLKACNTVKDNAESLHRLFCSTGSEEDRLKEILTKIAEVLKLQELPAIQMQVVSLGTACPDLSGKHVSALLKLKSNLSKADRRTVKETLSDISGHGSDVAAPPFFSTVQVK